MRSLSSLLLALLAPAAASALALGPPLETPAAPSTPLGPVEIGAPPADRPPVAAPPVDLVLPAPQGTGGPPADLPPDLPDLAPPDVANGPPDSLPPGAGIPDLRGEVTLPPGAEHVFELAPPFGGTPGSRGARSAVPEPGTALLLAAGLVALGARRRIRPS